MAKLTMPDIFLFGLTDIIPIYEIIRALSTKYIATKSAMMPPSYKEQKFFRAALTLRVLIILDPFLSWTQLIF